MVKHFADSFVDTTLEAVLVERAITALLVCGMMTQNCVTHTAISKSAEKYQVTILPDCCTTVSEMLHLIALHAVSTRVALQLSTVVRRLARTGGDGVFPITGGRPHQLPRSIAGKDRENVYPPTCH